MKLKPEIIKLRKTVINAYRQGAKPETLYADIDRLAKLQAKATKTHLNCVYSTEQILTPKQLKLLIEHIE